MLLKPRQILAFIFIITLVLCTHLPAQEGKPELPAELKQKADALIQKLGDDEYAVREAAQAEIATLLQDTKTFDALLPYLKQQMDVTQDVEVKVRLERITTLFEFGITSSVLEKFPNIIARLTSSDPEVRAKFAGELTGLKNPDVVGALIRMLRDKDIRVSGAAEKALVKIGNAAVEPLIKALGRCRP
jgi:HEAT repeat protein